MSLILTRKAAERSEAPVVGASRPASLARLSGLVAMAALIGMADVLTGRVIGLSLFYLVPVVTAGWFLGRNHAVAVAAVAGLAALVADAHWQEIEDWDVATWNGLTRLGIFIAMGVLMARVRADQRRTRQLLDDAVHLATTDALTGLPNSRWFFATLHERLRDSASGTPISVAYVDVDNFKRVNDLAGHEAGNEVLCSIARSLASHAADGAITARLGGDEFALVFLGRKADEVEGLLDHLADETERIGLAHPGSELGLSVGLAHGMTPCGIDQLLRRADAQMYLVKAAHHGRAPERHVAGRA